MTRSTCPVCGNPLVWDYRDGFVVCSGCGLVVENIIEEARGGFEGEEELPARRRRPVKRVVSENYSVNMRLYKMAEKRVRNKPWLTVDYDAVLSTKRFVKTIMSKASIEAVENIEANGYWEDVRNGLKLIEELNPALLSRSERGKYALAYMLSVKVRTGKTPGPEDVARVFNISGTNYRRLYNIVKNLAPKIQPPQAHGQALTH